MLSADATLIAAGMPVVLEAWGGDHTLRGRVRSVEPAGFTRISALGVEEQRVKVLVTLAEVPAALGDGYHVEARIVLWQGEVLQVPISAVFRDHDRWAVYVVEGGIVRLAAVALGRRGRSDIEVVSGVIAGALVVLHPGDKVTAGARVTVRR